MTDYLCIFFMIHMADQVIRYHSLRIADRDFDPVLYEPDNISGEIRCKERKGGFPDQFDECILICLYKKLGCRHLNTAHFIPKSNLRT